tara:strand:+ start:496 stop:798 length:303 start_codon:yes stop_codon:yes gene_type:complete
LLPVQAAVDSTLNAKVLFAATVPVKDVTVAGVNNAVHTADDVFIAALKAGPAGFVTSSRSTVIWPAIPADWPAMTLISKSVTAPIPDGVLMQKYSVAAGD